MYNALQASAGQPDELLLALIHTTITIAFTCLLWIDEVLNLKFHDIEGNEKCLTITLQHCKTVQFGGAYKLPANIVMLLLF
jgi:hypothetical protein